MQRHKDWQPGTQPAESRSQFLMNTANILTHIHHAYLLQGCAVFEAT